MDSIPTIIRSLKPLTSTEVRVLDRQDARRKVWRNFGTIGFDAYVKWILNESPDQKV